MLDLRPQYNALWQNGKEKISSGEIHCDFQLDNPNDQRFGITLLLRPNAKILEEIQRFCEKIKEIEPRQYYYPQPDVHVTVSSIISCYEGFKLDSIDIKKYSAIVEKILSAYSRFVLKFEGITATNAAVMIQGFPQDTTLEDLRNEIRSIFKQTNLQHSIDARYKLETAHATVVRFKTPLENPTRFLSRLDEYRNHRFGTTEVESLELVFNDWYQQSARVKLLKSFTL